jgi:hypothetical protein
MVNGEEKLLRRDINAKKLYGIRYRNFAKQIESDQIYLKYRKSLQYNFANFCNK